MLDFRKCNSHLATGEKANRARRFREYCLIWRREQRPLHGLTRRKDEVFSDEEMLIGLRRECLVGQRQ